MDDFLNQIVIDVKVIEFGCVGDRFCGMALCYCSISALAEYFIPGYIIGSVFQVLGMEVIENFLPLVIYSANSLLLFS